MVTLSQRSLHPDPIIVLHSVRTDYSMAAHPRIAGPALADLAI